MRNLADPVIETRTSVDQRWRRLAFGVIIFSLMALGVAAPFVTPVHAAGVLNLVVDTLDAGTRDTDPGDGVCMTANNNCSLRAAIEEGNVTAAGTEVEITVLPGLSGTIVMSTDKTTHMADTKVDKNKEPDRYPAGGVGWYNASAYFFITRTMTIDLDNRLHTRATAEAAGDTGSAAFFVDAPDVKLRNFSSIFSNECSIIFSQASDGSSLEGGETINSANNWSTSMIRIRPGAERITIRNYRMGRFASKTYSGLIRLSSSSDPDTTHRNDPIKDVTIENVVFDDTPASSTCSATDGRGCTDTAIDIYVVAVHGLVVKDCEFINQGTNSHAIDAHDGGALSNWDIRDNLFKDIKTGGSYLDAAIYFPRDKAMTGTSYIRGNVMDNSGTTAQHTAIYIYGDHAGTTTSSLPSNVYIEDNQFDGYHGQTVLLDHTSSLTVRRNTFGVASGAQATTTTEETITGVADSAKGMVRNYGASANRRLLTWYPTVANATTSCELEVTVNPQTAGSYGTPKTPVTLDFYYTRQNTAETYLGSVGNLTAATTVTVPHLPTGPGYIRVQTHSPVDDGQVESSQLSRTVSITNSANLGNCDQPFFNLELRAWRDVSHASPNHASILAPGGGTEIPTDSVLTPGEEVWFTYTVTNDGVTPLQDVRVRDSLGHGQMICLIPVVQPNQSEGCAESYTVSP
ncbi:MAG: hypothetical protein LBH68_05870 [Bifidobacteriaceae bacterium]|jgi:hypothetical protein|nr:hypothetical protein [Bifidobacteriaceae bacterium]